MANNSDGSIVLTVTIDKTELLGELSKLKSVLNNTTSEFSKTSQGAKQAENAFQSLSNFIKIQEERLNALKQQYASYVLQNQQNSTAAKKLKEDIKNLSTSLDENRKKLDNSKNAANVFDKSMTKIKKATNSTITGLKRFASALGIYFSLREILRFSNEASKLASQQEANLKRLDMLYGESAKYVYEFANANANAFGMAKSAAYDAAADYGNIFRTFADGAKSAQMTNDMLRVTAVVASQTGRTYEDVFEKIRSGLYGNTRAIDDLGLSVRQSSLMQTQAYQQISQNGVRSWNSLTDAELQNARALGIIEQANIHYGNSILQSTALIRSQFNAAWTDFKVTWGQAVNLVLIPILTVATRILTTITEVMQKIFHLSGKQGKQASATSKVSSNIGGAADNQDKLTDSVGKTNQALKETNKELKRELASFDEIEVLSRNTSDNATGGVSTVGGSSAGSGLNTVGGDTTTTTTGGGDDPLIKKGEIDMKLAMIGTFAGAALVGLGVFMMFSGHLFLGLGMVAVGALGVWSSLELLQDLPIDLKQKLAKALQIVGMTAFILGVILIFVPGCLAAGLGLMALGVTALKASQQLTGGNFDISSFVLKVIIIAGLIAFTLGVIMLFIPGCRLAGLGLMAKGALAIAALVGLKELGWQEIKEKIETVATSMWKVIYTIGIIMVVVGVVLLFSPFPLVGLALMLIGIAAIVTETALGGDQLKEELKKFCVKYWKVLYAVGALMVVVGVVLLFSPNPLIGLALMLVGIAELVEATELGGDQLEEEFQKFILTYWDTIKKIELLVFVVGIVLLFTPAWGVGVALLLLGYTALKIEEQALDGTETKLGLLTQFDSLTSWVKNIMAAAFVIGMILAFVPGCLTVGLALMGSSAAALFGKQAMDNSALKTELEKQLNSAKETAKKGVDDINSEYAKIGNTAPKTIDVREKLSGTKVKYNVPGLARGAVIPANREFLAVLGDQKSGTNIEAPLKTIEQALENVLVRANIESGERSAPTTVVLQVNDREFGRAVVDLGGKENRIRGNSFVKTKLIYG